MEKRLSASEIGTAKKKKKKAIDGSGQGNRSMIGPMGTQTP